MFYSFRSLRFILLIPIFAILFFIFKQHVSSFGCFDDCFNFMGAFFMLKGKTLYSQIFFNHQMLMAYISFLVQKILHPHTIYHLVLYHRYVTMAFAFAMDILLVWRFGWISVLFVVCYEFTKFYFFGDRFLAEGFIVYPLVYTIGVLSEYIKKKSERVIDICIVSLSIWFVIFSREPYIPVAVFLFLTFIFLIKRSYKLLSIFLLSLLSFLTLYKIPLQEYWFNIFTLNNRQIVHTEIGANGGILLQIGKIIGYPIITIFGHKDTFVGQYLAILSAVFLLLISIKIIRKRWLESIFILTTLSLANVRYVIPGTIFYESFHMLVWYGLFIFFLLFLAKDIFSVNRRIGIYALSVLFASWIFVIFSPRAYVWEKVDRQAEFVTNYGQYVSNGSVIRSLSQPTDTLFLDGHDDLIYWQADRISPYPYAWYTSFMPGVRKYTKAREALLKNMPPDFYYGSCFHSGFPPTTMPEYMKKEYTQLYFSNKPSCLYIKNTKLPQITKMQWNNIQKFGYYLPI